MLMTIVILMKAMNMRISYQSNTIYNTNSIYKNLYIYSSKKIIETTIENLNQ